MKRTRTVLRTRPRAIRKAESVVRGILLCLATASHPALAHDFALTAQVNEPLAIGAHTFAGGTLHLRSIRSYNPVIELHELCIDDTCLGLVLAQREGSSETRQGAFVFDRGPSGRLVLTGYRLPDGRGTTFYRLLHWEAPARAGGAGAPPTAFRSR